MSDSRCGSTCDRTKNCPIVKFTDDTGLTGLISNDDDSYYRQEIEHFVTWCNDNYLNVKKKMAGEDHRMSPDC